MTIINFSTVKNDTFNPTWIIEFLLNDVAIDLTGCEIKAEFKLPNSEAIVWTMTTVDSSILIVSPPTSGKIQFASQIIDIAAGKYNYDIQITFTDDVVKTYVRGVFTVIQDITDSIPVVI